MGDRMLLRYIVVYIIGLIGAIYMTWGINEKSVELWLFRFFIAGVLLFILSLMQPRKKKE